MKPSSPAVSLPPVHSSWPRADITFRALSGIRNKTEATVLQRIEVEYPQTFARALANLSTTSSAVAPPFRFVFTTGMVSERSQTRSLVFWQTIRRWKGLAETQLLALAQTPEYKRILDVVVARPGLFLGKDATVARLVGGFFPGSAITVEDLSAALVDLAMKGAEKDTVDTVELRALGRRRLAEMARSGGEK